jgi:hypothetical protein
MSSMRILDLQRRLREVGRIRIGEQVATSNGRSRPAKLEVFRFTSRDQAVISAAADKFGGTVEPWESPDGQQWQVKTTANELPVVVPPGDMAFSQAYEQWTAGGCRVRCDGRWDHVGDKACHCDPENRSCAIHTRLSVMVPDLPGLGVWRLDTSGYYAAVELGGVVDLAAGFAEAGRLIPARLRLEQRSVKRIKPDGKTETRRFAVPVLDLDVHPMQLAGGTPVAIGSGGGPGFEPVPVDLQLAPVAAVADQVKGLGDGTTPAKRRRNAATPIPATGAKPRTAAEAEGAGEVGPPVLPLGGKSEVPVESESVETIDADRAAAIQRSIDELDAESKQDLGQWWKGNRFPALKSGNLEPQQADDIEKAIAAYAPFVGEGDDDTTPDPNARNKKSGRWPPRRGRTSPTQSVTSAGGR